MSRDSSHPLTNPAAATRSSAREVSYEISRSARIRSSTIRPVSGLRRALRPLGDDEESLQPQLVALGHPPALTVLLGGLQVALDLAQPVAQLGGIELARLMRL